MEAMTLTREKTIKLPTVQARLEALDKFAGMLNGRSESLAQIKDERLSRQ
jgi:hypothetical protein